MPTIIQFSDIAKVIILAAGSSSRYGGIKALAELAPGFTMLDCAIKQALSMASHVTVITGAYHKDISRHLRSRDASSQVTVVCNPHWRAGMSASLHAAVDVSADSRGILVLTVDQPSIPETFFARLAETVVLDPERPVMTAYGETTGVPAWIPRNFFPRVLELRGDRGAKSVLWSANCAQLSCEEAAYDIDTVGDLRRLRDESKI